MRGGSRGRRGGVTLGVDLFPILSIFLAVMGVLAFINLISTANVTHQAKLVPSGTYPFHEPYQIICHPDGAILMPPVERLAQILADAGADAPQALVTILADRRAYRADAQGLTFRQAKVLSWQPEGPLFLLLAKEILQVNDMIEKLAQVRETPPYREYLLFGIMPGGSETYHRIRQVIRDNEQLWGIPIGLEPLDLGWQVIQ